jgi:hypothetical protein
MPKRYQGEAIGEEAGRAFLAPVPRAVAHRHAQAGDL